MGAGARAPDGSVARAQILEMLEPGVGTVPGHRWGEDRAWRRPCSRACSLVSQSPLSETPGCTRAVPGQLRDPLHHRALTPGIGFTAPGGGLCLVWPRVCPGRGAGAAGGGGARGRRADGRRRWGERARQRVNKCGAQRARTCGGRSLRAPLFSVDPAGSGAGIQCFQG